MKPREKLSKIGSDKLTDSELLSIILRHGNKKESVFQITNRITHQGTFYNAFGLKPDQISTFCELNTTHSQQICALIELLKRQKSSLSFRISDTLTAFNHLKSMQSLRKEVIRGMYLNAKMEIIHEEAIAIGTLTTSSIHPREILSPALTYSAYCFILAHNHPSGDPHPSNEDIKATIQIAEAAKTMQIPLLDHIIIGNESYFSFQEQKIIK